MIGLKKKILGLACVILSASLALSVTQPLKATSIQDEKDRQKEIESNIEDTEEILRELESLKSDTNAYILAMDDKLNEITAYIDNLNEQIEDKKLEIEQINVTLTNQEQDINSQYEAMKKRIQFMYENGQTEYLELILNSGSISDFLNRAEYMSKITEYDRNMLNKMKETKEQIEITKQTLEQEQANLDSLMASAEEEKAAVEKLVDEKSKLLEATEAKISSAETEIDQMQGEIAASKAIVAELEELERKQKEEEERKRKEEEERRKQAEQNGQKVETPVNTAPKYEGGQFLWPVPGWYTITSEFGWRVSPDIAGKPGSGQSEFHSGLDIAAPNGTNIIAACGGTVAWAYKSASAGNWIGIDHGNGLFTVYMHMSKFNVSQGDVVQAGDVIGFVGSTGWSTGNHLHFSVRLNGEYVNPHNYLGK